MAVGINVAWVIEGDYPTNGLSLAAVAGSDRVGILVLTGEIQNDAGGAVGIASITWGGQTCTEVFQANAGDVTAYNNVVGMWYVTEAQIAAMSGSAITVTWENFNGNGTFGTGGIGPFGNGKVAAAYYEDVDQANIVSATNDNTTGATSGTATNIDMGVIDTDVDEQVIVGTVSGQGTADDDFDAPTGWTQEVEVLGATNDHNIAIFSRDSQANDDALNTNFVCGSANRLAIGSISLGAATGDQNIAVGLNTETDLAQPIAVVVGGVSIPVGLVSEVDLAQPIAVQTEISVAVGLVTEVNLAQPITPVVGGVSIPVGLVTEINASQPMGVFPEIGVAIGLVSEVNFAQPITPVLSISIPVGLVTEIDLAQPIAVATEISVAIGLVTEVDFAQPITVSQATVVAVGQVVEVDLAQPVGVTTGGVSIPVGLVTEVDLAQPIAAEQGQVISVGQVTEIDLSQSITPVVGAAIIPVGQVIEVNFAQPIGIAGQVFGGKYNAIEEFPTGSTVTISLFDPVTLDAIALDSNVCIERGVTGLFIWDASKLTTFPIGYQEYIYDMTDSIDVKSDILRIPQHDFIDYLKAKEIFG